MKRALTLLAALLLAPLQAAQPDECVDTGVGIVDITPTEGE